jgi:hypothetical protein
MSLEEVRKNCEEILKRCGRAPESLQILAVSKLQPVEKIQDLYQRGQWRFGENYVQEALEKQRALHELKIEWHLIGTLQKNKVKQVVGKFALLHAVESLRLAETISRVAEKNQLCQHVLLQVNIAGEATKGGFTAEELLQVWPQIQALPNLQVDGLMTMPPLSDQGETVRPYFRKLRELQEMLLRQTPQESTKHPLRELSMGTSHDYHIAIEEGATIVRLGTILFGERPQHRTQL